MLAPKSNCPIKGLKRVDVRVLPVDFRFAKPKDITLYPANWWMFTSVNSHIEKKLS